MLSAQHQTAALPYRLRHGHVEVLLVTSRTRGRWILPKGNVDGMLGPRLSALREAYEEGGVSGVPAEHPLGHYRQGRRGHGALTAVYLLPVDHEAPTWPESTERFRRWVPISTAAEQAHGPDLRLLLKKAARLLQPARRATPPFSMISRVA